MEHKFGLFESVEELNKAAAAQKEEGDTEALFSLAAENGISQEDVEDYFEGYAEELATPLMAALGKLEQEEVELDLKSQLKDWKDFLAHMCAESDEMCRAVFRPDRNLEDYLAEAIKFSSQNRRLVPAGIAKKAGLPTNIYIGMTGRDELRRIARRYYLGEE